MSTTDNGIDWPQVGDRVRLNWLGTEYFGTVKAKELDKEYGSGARWDYVVRLDAGQTIRQTEDGINVV